MYSRVFLLTLMASNMNTTATSVAKQSSVKRVMYFTMKLRLNTTKIKSSIVTQIPIHNRNSMKSMLYLLK